MTTLAELLDCEIELRSGEIGYVVRRPRSARPAFDLLRYHGDRQAMAFDDSSDPMTGGSRHFRIPLTAKDVRGCAILKSAEA